MLDGAPTLRHPGGQDVMSPHNVCSTGGVHQLLNLADEPARLVICSAPVAGPSASVYRDDNAYVLRVPGQTRYRFRVADKLGDCWDGVPGAGSA